jgi:hypothetical protein
MDMNMNIDVNMDINKEIDVNMDMNKEMDINRNMKNGQEQWISPTYSSIQRTTFLML